MKHLHMRVLGVFGVLSMSACSNHLQGQVERLERSLSEMRNIQAEQTSKIAALDGDVRQLVGRVEEVEFSSTRKMGADLNNLKDDLSSLRRRVPPPPIVPADALEQDEAGVAALDQELSGLMADGFLALREAKFDQALGLFEEGAAKSRGTDQYGNAVFWAGVACEGRGDGRKALEAYREVASLFPKGPRTPLALFRQGTIFLRLGDKKLAKLSFQKLVADFPNSDEGRRAKERLKEL